MKSLELMNNNNPDKNICRYRVPFKILKVTSRQIMFCYKPVICQARDKV